MTIKAVLFGWPFVATFILLEVFESTNASASLAIAALALVSIAAGAAMGFWWPTPPETPKWLKMAHKLSSRIRPNS
jgi:hypothetical protein